MNTATATQTQIAFSTDRKGRKVAHKWSTGARRWITVGVKNAELMLNIGEAREVVRLNPDGTAR